MTDSFSKKVTKSFLQNFTGGSIKTVSTIISGYFYALILGPALYGVWQTARIFLGYGAFTSLGIPFVIQRDFPALIKEGKKDQAHKLAQLGISFSAITTILLSSVFIVWALFFKGDHNFRISIVVIALYILVSLPSGIGNLLHKAVNDYKTLGIAESILGIGYLIIVPFVYWYGFKLLLLGFLVITTTQSVYYYVHRPIQYKWFWDKKLLYKTILIAFPIFLVAIIGTVFSSIDRLLIASMLSFENVGLYSLSTFIAQPITLLISSFSIVLFTQLTERYGLSKEAHVIDKHVTLPQSVFSNLIPPFIGMGLIALPLLTQVFLPKYQGGITAAQFNVFAIFFIMISGFSGNALFILGKQKLSAISFFIAGCIKTIGSYIGIKAGYGIVSVAFFSVISYFIYDSLMLYFVNINLGYDLKTYFSRLFNKLLCPISVLLFCIFYMAFHKQVFEQLGIGNAWLQLLIGELVFILFSFVFILKAYRKVTIFF